MILIGLILYDVIMNPHEQNTIMVGAHPLHTIHMFRFSIYATQNPQTFHLWVCLRSVAKKILGRKIF